MNIQRNALLKKSKATSQCLAKEAYKSGNSIEAEGTFPIYMVVLSNVKNDDILIIHAAYSLEPFQSSLNNHSELNAQENFADVKKLPGDQPLRVIVDKDPNRSGAADNVNIDC